MHVNFLVLNVSGTDSMFLTDLDKGVVYTQTICASAHFAPVPSRHRLDWTPPSPL